MFSICLDSTSNKFDPKSLPCVFLGYSDKHKGYKCFYPPTRRTYISRHVTFDEQCFPFKAPGELHQESRSLPLSVFTDLIPMRTPSPPPIIPVEFTNNVSSVPDIPEAPRIPHEAPTLAVASSLTSPTPDLILDVPSRLPGVAPTSSSPPTDNMHSMVTRSKASIIKPNPRYANLHLIPSEPKTLRSALKHDGWT